MNSPILKLGVACATALISIAASTGCHRTSAAGAGVTHFVNSRGDAKAPGLAEHFMVFSFDYPNDWKLDPETGSPTASNLTLIALQRRHSAHYRRAWPAT